MAFDRFLIAPLNTGLQTDLRPFLIPEDAFTKLQNCYVFRGRVTKRFGSIFMNGGSQLTSRLRVQVGTIGSPVSPVPNAGAFTPTQFIGQQFSAGTQIFTVYQTGAPAAMLATGPGTGTFNTTTGAFALAATGLGAGTPIYWYPLLPVMGLSQYEIGTINNHPTFGFDTDFAYEYSPSTGWFRVGTGTLPIWHGTNNQFFWTCNWDGITPDVVILFVTNFNAHLGLGLVTDDPIWTYNGVPNTWAPFSYSPTLTLNPGNMQPITVTTTKTNGTIITNYVQQARIIVSFKNRLLLLNTIENNANGADQWNSGSATTTGNTPARYLTSTNTQFKNRCRYSHNGSPFASNAWLEPNQIYAPDAASGTTVVADGGGFIDATTEEAIVSAEFIKDRLIVYFERSTWELAYTGNEVLPFVWQKINTELGSQATFSTVPFDTSVLTIGNTGVHSCSGASVERIDHKIPQQIFTFKTESDDQLRTCGIRDYFNELVYWAFVNDDATSTQTYPNEILIYNYQNHSWALFDDCFTAFGYLEQTNDQTWASIGLPWRACAFAWNSGVLEADQRQIIGGTPEGFVLQIDEEVNRNAPSMSITQMTIPSTLSGANYVDLEVINHNCALNDFVAVENTNGISLPITSIYKVTSILDANNITIFAPDISGTYTGGGTLARVSNIQISTKQWNPYLSQDRNFYLQRIDFIVEKTSSGQITVDYYPSSSNVSMIQGGNTSGAIMGNSVLETSPYDPIYYPLEQYQERLTHPVYFQTTGNAIQLIIYFTDQQISNGNIAYSDFELDGLVLYCQPTASRMQ